MANTRKFMISSDVWGGFSIFVDINQHNDIKGIINVITPMDPCKYFWFF